MIQQKTGTQELRIIGSPRRGVGAVMLCQGGGKKLRVGGEDKDES